MQPFQGTCVPSNITQTRFILFSGLKQLLAWEHFYRNRRLFVSLAIALVSGALCWGVLHARGPTTSVFGGIYYGADFGWSYNAAREFLAGLDPYRFPPFINYTPYPFPAVLAAMPFLILPSTIGAAAFFGLSSGFMSYGLTKNGWSKLWAFGCCPYWTALQWVQWTPLIFAAAFFPILALTVCIKPNIALPVVLTRLNKIMVLSAFGFLVVSLVVFPTWPLHWLKSIGGYQSYFALVTLPGPLLLLALKRWRDPDAKFLLLASVFPQRWFYDALILWLIPKTRKEMLYTAAFSWVAFAWMLMDGREIIEVGPICVISFHLPMLLLIMRRKNSTIEN